MKLDVPYGEKRIGVEAPDRNLLGIFYPNEVKIKDERETLINAIENPIGKSLQEILVNGKEILFIVNDQTRATPTGKVLDVIYPGIKNKRVKFLIATGVHRSPTHEELSSIFCKYYAEFKDRIHIHDAKKEEDIVCIGKTKKGTEVCINKLAVQAHKIIPIGSVEPHYFAGYTGGRKSFIPGIAGYRTIEQNHKHALSPEAKPLALRGNPVHEDMVDALKFLKEKLIFSIQIVLDGKQRIYKASAGDIHGSFEQAVRYAQEVFCVQIPKKADIVVAVAYFPLDINLFQAHKAIEHGKLALKEDGILILVAPCEEGIGPDKWFNFMSSCNNPQEIIDKVKKGYKLGYHKAVKLAELTNRAEIWGVSELPDYIMEAVFVQPFHELQLAINFAIEKKGEDAKVLFLMDGTIMVPIVSE